MITHGRSWSIPVNDDALSAIPMWTSRDVWQQQLCEQLATAQGSALCRHYKVLPEKVYAVGVVHSLYADSATGRGVTASVPLIGDKAGVSCRTVQRARRVIKELGLGVELERGRYLTTDERLVAHTHHGGHQWRAASVWVLTIPPERTR